MLEMTADVNVQDITFAITEKPVLMKPPEAVRFSENGHDSHDNLWVGNEYGPYNVKAGCRGGVAVPLKNEECARCPRTVYQCEVKRV